MRRIWPRSDRRVKRCMENSGCVSNCRNLKKDTPEEGDQRKRLCLLKMRPCTGYNAAAAQICGQQKNRIGCPIRFFSRYGMPSGCITDTFPSRCLYSF